MFLLLIYFICILPSSLSTTEKIIPVLLHRMLSSYNSPFLIGNDNYRIYLDISLSSNQTWISSQLLQNPLFYEHTDIIQKNISLTIHNNKIYANIIRDKIGFIGCDHKIKLQFINVENRIQSHYDTFALGFRYDDIKYSTVHQLFNKGLIGMRAFGIGVDPNNFRKYVFYGGLPLSIISQSDIIDMRCNVNVNFISWGCNLKWFGFLNANSTHNIKYYNKDEGYIYFETNYHYIRAPVSFFNYLEKEYASDYFRKHYCWYDIDKNIQCQCEMVIGVKHFDFMINVGDDRKVILIKSEELFNRGSKYCQLLIELNDEGEKWVIGVEMIKRVNIEFNYDRKEILFISSLKGKGQIALVNNTGIIASMKEKIINVQVKYLYIGIMNLLLFNIIMLLFIYKKV